MKKFLLVLGLGLLATQAFANDFVVFYNNTNEQIGIYSIKSVQLRPYGIELVANDESTCVITSNFLTNNNVSAFEFIKNLEGMNIECSGSLANKKGYIVDKISFK